MSATDPSTMLPQRPGGIVAIVVLFAVTAAYSMVMAALIAIGRIPLAWGAFLLGGGLEELGPTPFLINAALLIVLALGLWNRWRWARRATIALALVGIALVVPAISSAVTDSRAFAIAREGVQIIVRVVIFFYLSQEPVKDWFDGR